MPRKSKFSAEDVVQAAVALVRQNGLAALSAPAVATQLGASTMPIYSHFKNMQALEDAVVERAWGRFRYHQDQHYTGDRWIDQAVGYIRFAREEPHLFKCLTDGRNEALKAELNRRQWARLGDALEGYAPFQTLDAHQIARARYVRAMLSHGIASSAKIGLNKLVFEDDELLVLFMADVSKALLIGFEQVPPLAGEARRLMEERVKAAVPKKATVPKKAAVPKMAVALQQAAVPKPE
ncbi:MAG: TetR/AcrR family transcriptional regulator [Desulfosarcinaceae bacterium]|nr:TetR/AcrR family transcriptional regulator [Desulfosarcinaceae bacterium]